MGRIIECSILSTKTKPTTSTLRAIKTAPTTTQTTIGITITTATIMTTTTMTVNIMIQQQKTQIQFGDMLTNLSQINIWMNWNGCTMV